MFPYKCVLVTGATSGIGQQLAHRLIAHGTFVIATGRRRERLDELAAQYGDRIAVEEIDFSDTTVLQPWVERLLSAHPIDCILLNAGFQTQPVLLDPASVSLSKFTAELTANYTSVVHTILLFLPHLQRLSASQPTAVVTVTSGLAIIPSARAPTYSASKAALRSFTWTLRETLRGDYPGLKVVEIVPPAVQTEIHSRQGLQQFGLPLDEFMDETWKGLLAGDEEVAVGTARSNSAQVDGERRSRFQQFVKAVPAPRP